MAHIEGGIAAADDGAAVGGQWPMSRARRSSLADALGERFQREPVVAADVGHRVAAAEVDLAGGDLVFVAWPGQERDQLP